MEALRPLQGPERPCHMLYSVTYDRGRGALVPLSSLEVCLAGRAWRRRQARPSWPRCQPSRHLNELDPQSHCWGWLCPTAPLGLGQLGVSPKSWERGGVGPGPRPRLPRALTQCAPAPRPWCVTCGRNALWPRFPRSKLFCPRPARSRLFQEGPLTAGPTHAPSGSDPLCLLPGGRAALC